MKSLGALWFALQPRQRLIGLLGLAAFLAALVGLIQAAGRPSMVALYSGLESAAAGEVVAAVEAMNVPVEIRGSTVLVPEAERDRLRLALAADGLPKNGPAGYELLEQLDAFSTSSNLFEATYWRAKEGELARTILAAPGVRAARVHIANPVGQPFRRAASPSASVSVTMASGALSPDLAEAIRFMVSSAVTGLAPEAVTVVDAARGAVLRPDELGPSASTSGLERQERLRAEIERLLGARVGEGKAIVTVALETTTDSETVVERILDPDSRIAISSDARTVEETSTGGTGGGATVASNLPVEAGEEGEPARSTRSETQERVNYEVSETTRERVRRPGEIRRLTVAVLVDGVARPGADGAPEWAPRTEEELARLRDLVKSAVGFDEARGDVVTVETLEFVESPEAGVEVEAGAMRFLERNAGWLIQVGALAAVALGLIVFVLRPLSRAAREAVAEDVGRLPPVLAYGPEEEDDLEEAPADRVALLRDAFSAHREDSASLLRSWLERDLREADDDPDADAAAAR